MKLSIIVPAFNEEKLLAESLGHIQLAAEAVINAGWLWELIVCDNNSTDRTAEVARRAGATVIFEPFNQIARARNRGAAVASGDWLLFIDADSYPSRGLFLDLLQAMRSGNVIGGGAAVRMEHPAWWHQAMLWNWNRVSCLMRWAAGSFVFCQASAFRELGGFSQELFAAEELEFSQRLKRLARQRRLKVVILRRNPLKTSARKADLYSLREFTRLFWNIAIKGGRPLRDRMACGLWYDGRR